MHFYPQERLAVFIDGVNLYSTAKELGFDVDFKRLLALFQQWGQLVGVRYYSVVTEDQDEFSVLRPLLDWLEYNGYTTITKLAKEGADRDGRRRVIGKMNVEIAVDAMQLAPHLDHIVFVTGNGDYCALIGKLQKKRKRVSVVSTLESEQPMLADALRRQADQVIDLDAIRAIIMRPELPAPRAARMERAGSSDGGALT